MIDKPKLSEPNVSSLIYQYDIYQFNIPNVVIYGICSSHNIKECYFYTENIETALMSSAELVQTYNVSDKSVRIRVAQAGQ